MAAAPLLAVLGPWIARLPEDRFPTCDNLNALLPTDRSVVSGAGVPLIFTLPIAATDDAYEESVFSHGQVPTRAENAHDLFNALAWLAFPHLKARLNARHVLDLRSNVADRKRSRLRDQLTLFDEGGLIFATSDPALAALLIARDWPRLFFESRTAFGSRCSVTVFGHALFEKGLTPYRGLTGKALVMRVSGSFFADDIDRQRAQLDLAASVEFAHGMPVLHPLPVLGVPGWAAENNDRSYYDDTEYFRPKKAWE